MTKVITFVDFCHCFELAINPRFEFKSKFMKSKILFISLSLIYSLIQAQNISHNWSFNPVDTEKYGGYSYGNHVENDASGNTYLFGRMEGIANVEGDLNSSGSVELVPVGDVDVFLAKYDSLGNYVWAFNIGGVNYDYASGMDIENNQFIYITGYFSGLIDFDPSENDYFIDSENAQSIFVAKYDTSGNFIWAIHIPSLSNENISSTSIKVGQNDELYLTGIFRGNADFDPSNNEFILTSVNFEDPFVAKYDTDGNFEWVINFPVITNNGSAVISDIDIFSNGDFIIGGYFLGDFDLNPNGSGNILNGTIYSYNSFFAKYNSDGDFIYAKKIHGQSQSFYGNFIFSIDVDYQNNIYIAGECRGATDFDYFGAGYYVTNSDINKNSAFLAKYSETGNFEWVVPIEGQSINNRTQSVKADNIGNVFITGQFLGPANFNPLGTTYNLSSISQYLFFAKYNQSGIINWAYSLGDEIRGAYGYDIAVNNDGLVTFAGLFYDTLDFDMSQNEYLLSTGIGAGNAFVVQYDYNQGFKFAKRVGGYTSNYYDQNAYAITTDFENSFLVGGGLRGSVNVNPGSSETIITEITNGDAYLLKYNTFNDLIWAKVFPSTSNSYVSEIATHVDDIIIAGIFSGTINLNPTGNNGELTSSNNSIFLAGLSTIGTLNWKEKIVASSSIMLEDLKIDDSGNIFITGKFSGDVNFQSSNSTHTLTGQNDFFVAKYNINGTCQWVKKLSGTGDIVGKSIDFTEDKVIVGGNFRESLTYDILGNNNTVNSSNNSWDIFLAEFDNATGNISWVKKYGYKFEDNLFGLSIDRDDNIYIAGNFRDTTYLNQTTNQAMHISQGAADGFMAKYNSTGELIWSKQMSSSSYVRSKHVKIDNYNNAILVGEFGPDDVNLNFGGAPDLLESYGDYDVFIAMYSPDGDLLYKNKIYGQKSETAGSINIDNENTLYIAGQFREKIYLDINQTEVSLQSLNKSDAFFVKYNVCDNVSINETVYACNSYTAPNGVTYFTSGNYSAFVENFEPNCDSLINIDYVVINIDTEVVFENNILTANYFGSNVNYQWINCANNQPVNGATSQSFTPQTDGEYAVIITEYNCSETSECVNVTGVSIKDLNNRDSFGKVYPNPSSGKFNLVFDNQVDYADIFVYNMLGSLMQKSEITNSDRTQIDLSNLPNGSYVVQLKFENNFHSFKIVKM